MRITEALGVLHKTLEGAVGKDHVYIYSPPQAQCMEIPLAYYRVSGFTVPLTSACAHPYTVSVEVAVGLITAGWNEIYDLAEQVYGMILGPEPGFLSSIPKGGEFALLDKIGSVEVDRSLGLCHTMLTGPMNI